MKECPTPYKHPHTSRRDAEKGLQRMTRRAKTGLQPYKCSCGSWHLGHPRRRR